MVVAVSAYCLWMRLTALPADTHPFYIHARLETIAHRGGSAVFPENSLKALQFSAELGVDILEMDVRMTRDGHLVLFHDENLERTTNCKGKLSELLLTDIKKCDNAFWFSPIKRFSNTKEKTASKGSNSPTEVFPLRGLNIQIPTLEEVFETFPRNRMIIEIKPTDLQIVKRFCDFVVRFNKQEQILVGSFHHDVLKAFRLQCPKVATSASFKEALQFFILSKLSLSTLYTPPYTALQLPPTLELSRRSIFPDLSVTTPTLIRDAHKRNLIVHVWTVNEPRKMLDLQEIGVDGIMTDYPQKLKQNLVK